MDDVQATLNQRGIKIKWSSSSRFFLRLQSRNLLYAHPSLQSASKEVWNAVLRWIDSGKKEERLTSFIQTYQKQSRPLLQEEKIHSLLPRLSLLKEEYFSPSFPVCSIGYFTPSRKRRSSVVLGYCIAHLREIGVNSLLDDQRVPLFVVDTVLYHEMLHIQYPAKIVNNRRRIHTKEFRDAERAFVYFARFEQWKREHLPLLLNQKECHGRT